MPMILDYKLTMPWNNANSGNARWAFAKKKNKEYFIKEFPAPTYPKFGDIASEIYEKKIAKCRVFYEKKQKLYEQIRKSANGNIVAIEEFFRCNSKYYITTEKIQITKATIESISRSSDRKKRLLMKTLASSLQRLHENDVIHADIKPSNILIKETETGNFVAKIIDFDSSYLVNDIPTSEEIQGDAAYFAPETLRYMAGEDVLLTQKVDVFAAGLLFHEYYTGELPGYSSEYESVQEALLEGDKLVLADKLPENLFALISEMLALDADDRPDMKTVFHRIDETSASGDDIKSEDKKTKKAPNYENLWYRPVGFDI